MFVYLQHSVETDVLESLHSTLQSVFWMYVFEQELNSV